LSAQICSLSENVVLLEFFDAITGGIQLSLSATSAGVMAGVPSRRDTPMASKPLNGAVPGNAEVRLAKYSRGPFSHEKSPLASGCGPHAMAGSPSATRSFS
jgi:hypothetical protein